MSDKELDALTQNTLWIGEQVSRLSAWDYWVNCCRGLDEPIKSAELCDNMGVNPSYVTKLIEKIRKRYAK
tara:strand:- start:1081 stop:1290 length:210 start_codon:yes stop_codon:yes gene_type:complete